MSVIQCDNCETDIDTDWDVDCWCIQNNREAALCKFCRETTDDDIRWATETGQMQ